MEGIAQGLSQGRGSCRGPLPTLGLPACALSRLTSGSALTHLRALFRPQLWPTTFWPRYLTFTRLLNVCSKSIRLEQSVLFCFVLL